MREFLLDQFKTTAIIQNVKHLFDDDFELKAWEHPEFHRLSIRFGYKNNSLFTSTPLYAEQKYAIGCLEELLDFEKRRFEFVDFNNKDMLSDYLNTQLGHMIVHQRDLYEDLLKNKDSSEIISTICSSSKNIYEALYMLEDSF